MELARKENYFLDLEVQPKERVEKKNKTHKQREYRFQKVMAIFCIAVIFLMSIILVFRYSTIIKERHQVYSLINELELLNNQKRMLSIEMEKMLKSEWIEQEAKVRLDMRYPTTEETHYFIVDRTKLLKLTKQGETASDFEDREHSIEKVGVFRRLLGTVAGLLDR